MMTKAVEHEYNRGFDAKHDEANPYSRIDKRFYWWQAGFIDYWGQMPKHAMDAEQVK